MWIGSLITALLFTVGKFLLGAYLGRSSLSSAYGAVGSFVVVLLWVYYSSQILLLGAAFVRVYADRHGSHSQPRPGAEFVGKNSPHKRRPSVSLQYPSVRPISHFPTPPA